MIILKNSLKILKSISKYTDILELGVPHNALVADGNQIQTSAYRAIKNGIKLKDIFYIVKEFKKREHLKPIILMGYYNMVFQYGENRFLSMCKKVGVDGLILVDLPWPENKAFANKCKKKSIYFIQLLSPTTTKKIKKNNKRLSSDELFYINALHYRWKIKNFTQRNIDKL